MVTLSSLYPCIKMNGYVSFKGDLGVFSRVFGCGNNPFVEDRLYNKVNTREKVKITLRHSIMKDLMVTAGVSDLWETREN